MKKIVENPWTGNKAIVDKIKCNCSCHHKNSNMLHIAPCCSGGWILKYIDIKPLERYNKAAS